MEEYIFLHYRNQIPYFILKLLIYQLIILKKGITSINSFMISMVGDFNILQ